MLYFLPVYSDFLRNLRALRILSAVLLRHIEAFNVEARQEMVTLIKDLAAIGNVAKCK